MREKVFYWLSIPTVFFLVSFTGILMMRAETREYARATEAEVEQQARAVSYPAKSCTHYYDKAKEYAEKAEKTGFSNATTYAQLSTAYSLLHRECLEEQ